MNFSVGLSGLDVAQRAIEIIGTNIANSSTEGYHRQNIIVSSMNSGNPNNATVGGAEVTDISRSMDDLLERQLLRQHPTQGQLEQELQILTQIERSFGVLGDKDLGSTLNNYFSTLKELAGNPTSRALQEQVVWAADAVASQFRNFAEFVEDLRSSVVLQTDQMVEKINNLASEIADLNGQIVAINVSGGNANLLMDRRDQAMKEMAQIAPITHSTQSDQPGVMNVSIWGTPVVVSSTNIEVDVVMTESQKLGFAVKDSSMIDTGVTGGQIGGMINLNNTLLPDILNSMDSLALELVNQVNRLHVQGLGTTGSFTDLTGVNFGDPTDVLSDINSDITAGTLHVRMTDTQTGTVTYHPIAIDPSDTVNDVLTALNGVPNLVAAAGDGRFHLQTSDPTRYTFDFLPVSSVSQALAGGTATPAVSGLYDGSSNEEYTFTVVGSGDVGVDSIQLQMEDSSGTLIKNINVGLGYAAGDRIELGNGLYLTMTAGSLVNGDSFKIEALSDSDTSGFLAAAGLNTFFSGHSAATIQVREDIVTNPSRVATMLSPDLDDNTNASRIAALAETKLSTLGEKTYAESYRVMVTSIGEKILTRQTRHTSIENIVQQINNQRDAVGGVDINDEAAKLMMFEQMFQAMAKFMNTQEKTMEHLMQLLQ